ncbi:MAG: cation transporter [Oscillospiraceae bacterium]|nr:cation transporter [Oscillospiraceae bacterium]
MYRTTVGIDGMMCSMCQAHINDALRRAFEGIKVSSSHAKKRAEIISEAPLDEAKLRAAIEETGYKVLSVSSEPYERKGIFRKR